MLRNSNHPGMVASRPAAIIPDVWRKYLIQGIIIAVVIVIAHEYAQWTFDNPDRARQIAMGLEERPFVYRALVHWLAYPLVKLGMSPSQALTLVVILSAIGLLYALKYLFASFRQS